MSFNRLGTKEGWCSCGDDDTAYDSDGSVGGKLKTGTLLTGLWCQGSIRPKAA